MHIKKLLIATALTAAVAAPAMAATTNVAEGKSVFGIGQFGGAALSSITDGFFSSTPALWNADAASWKSTGNVATDPFIVIDLGANTTFNHLVLQGAADANYAIKYATGGLNFTTAWVANGTGGNGLQTWDSGSIDSITARYIGIYASGGLGNFSVSEFQAFQTGTGGTAPIPEPETYALMGLGLVGLVAARMRRRNGSVG
ncbi:discoidin domain-containing protein [Amantichitinum ursilacus]|uniref:PEP-CTERM motif protein n=1 Tax=Amantichitinum ursilacus TaxID=857265 RepID=A0A0N0XGN9_9NEIS|nr:discoidin domain-containing protein [Amantichitinum ursilacus]KPC50285.1 PEP-CTERM motif protein [Amantichitinum ursilacus]